MRGAFLKSCVVLAACAFSLAPQARAGADGPPPRLTGQWRIFPRAPFARPAVEEITARLTRQIDPVVALFPPEGSKVPQGALGDALIDGRARDQLFRLESLLRLYGRAFSDFDEYRRKVKEVEDALGAYSLAVDSLRFAEDRFKKEARSQTPDGVRMAEQQKALQALAQSERTARVVLARRLDRSSLGSELPELPALVRSSLVGWGPSRDLTYVNRELQRMLRDVRYGRFDFNLLEDGIHEFRRRLRWFPMSIDSLDGLILVRDDPPGSCPLPDLEALAGSAAARHRYANPALRFPATHTCTISRCLLWQVSKTVRDLGHLKDEAEGEASLESVLNDHELQFASSNKATAREIARAKAIRAELYSSRALETLIAQLSSCKP